MVLIISNTIVRSLLDNQIQNRFVNTAISLANSRLLKYFIDENTQQFDIDVLEDSHFDNSDLVAEFAVFNYPNEPIIGRYSIGDDYQKLLELASDDSKLSYFGDRTPIVNSNGELIGGIDISYMREKIEASINEKRWQLIFATIILMLLGLLGSFYIARQFKKDIFNLEPEEIGRLFKERNAVLRSISEGIIAVDQNGIITLLNKSAKQILGISLNTKYRGKSNATVPAIAILESNLAIEQNAIDVEVWVNAIELIASRIIILEDGDIMGLLYSFRRRSEIDELAKKLSQVNEYAELLRGQTHEYSNKLHTLGGLIQTKNYSEALQLIGSETRGYQVLIEFLIKNVSNQRMSGLLLGKYNRARELGIELDIDTNSEKIVLHQNLKIERLVTILGNLIENAFTAVIASDKNLKKVVVSWSSTASDLVFDIEDSGTGIADENLEKIFDKGFSTSNKIGKGIGLWHTKNAIDYLGGKIEVSSSDLGGAMFSVVLQR